jgi:hypothetical protein
VNDSLQVLPYCLSTEFVEMHTAVVDTNRLHVHLGIAETVKTHVVCRVRGPWYGLNAGDTGVDLEAYPGRRTPPSGIRGPCSSRLGVRAARVGSLECGVLGAAKKEFAIRERPGLD